MVSKAESIYLNHNSVGDRFACKFLVRYFFGRGAVSICYTTLGWVREMLYIFALYNI